MRKGFTLIEFMVILAIISILAAILFPVFIKAGEKAWEKRVQDIRSGKIVASPDDKIRMERMPKIEHPMNAVPPVAPNVQVATAFVRVTLDDGSIMNVPVPLPTGRIIRSVERIETAVLPAEATAESND